jgi:hypothetical protein
MEGETPLLSRKHGLLIEIEANVGGRVSEVRRASHENTQTRHFFYAKSKSSLQMEDLAGLALFVNSAQWAAQSDFASYIGGIPVLLLLISFPVHPIIAWGLFFNSILILRESRGLK